MSRYTDFIQSQILLYMAKLDHIQTKKGIFFKSPTRRLKGYFSEDGIPVTSFMIGKELRKMGGVTKTTTRKKTTYNGIEFDKSTVVYKAMRGVDNE